MITAMRDAWHMVDRWAIALLAVLIGLLPAAHASGPIYSTQEIHRIEASVVSGVPLVATSWIILSPSQGPPVLVRNDVSRVVIVVGEMCHARNRWYSPRLGRFVNRDPIGYIDGMSLYAGYFSPNGLDPSGLDDVRVDSEGHVYVIPTSSGGDAGTPVFIGINPLPGPYQHGGSPSVYLNSNSPDMQVLIPAVQPWIELIPSYDVYGADGRTYDLSVLKANAESVDSYNPATGINLDLFNHTLYASRRSYLEEMAAREPSIEFEETQSFWDEFIPTATDAILSIERRGFCPTSGFAKRVKGPPKPRGVGRVTPGKWTVGPYKDLYGTVPGLDAHHVGQQAIMSRLIPGYDFNSAPSILVPKFGHTIRGPNGIVSRNMTGFSNPRDVVARDIFELRRVYPDVPNSSLRELIEMNRTLYPGAMQKP